MSRSIETDELQPWTVARTIDALPRLEPFLARDILRALRADDKKELAGALRHALPVLSGTSHTSAAALLLMLNDEAGSRPFLNALRGADGKARNLAIEFLYYELWPRDLTPAAMFRSVCPLDSEQVYDAIKRDLHEPWSGLSERVLDIVSQQNYPQSLSVTRPLLAHRDKALRLKIANCYLRAGRDEGAFAIVETEMLAAPGFVTRGGRSWYDFQGPKGLWHCVEDAAKKGDASLKAKAAALTMKLVTDALDAPDRAQRFHVNDGLIRAYIVSEILAAVMPAGARELMERMIRTVDIGDYDRSCVLESYAKALGEDARPLIVPALQDVDLRAAAAKALKPLAAGRNDPADIAALSLALAGEERPDVIAAVAAALVAAGPDGHPAAQAAVEQSTSWGKVELYWRMNGGTDRQLADLLTEAGVMDAVSDEELEEAMGQGFEIRALIHAGGNRLVCFNAKASGEINHMELFQDLLDASRPVVSVENFREVRKADLIREQDAGGRLHKITDMGTVCTVSFRHGGQDFSFDASPSGRWHDVAAVMKGFNAFMQAIGRDDRCYQFEEGGEVAILVVAPASKFEPVAARLHIPIEKQPEHAQDEAKAYVRHIQNLDR